MANSDEKAHSEHLAHTRDHLHWRQDHLEALAILKQAEAAIYTYQARIIAHEAEIVLHEEQITHGDGNDEGLRAGEHAHYAKEHPHEHNESLLAAIHGLEVHLNKGV